MMASLPSYQEAIQRPDWLELVAPYVSVRDFAGMARVSSRFYGYFAPRLWNDPLTAARRLGLHPDNGWTPPRLYFSIPSVHLSLSLSFGSTNRLRQISNGISVSS